MINLIRLPLVALVISRLLSRRASAGKSKNIIESVKRIEGSKRRRRRRTFGGGFLGEDVHRALSSTTEDLSCFCFFIYTLLLSYYFLFFCPRWFVETNRVFF